MRKLEHEIRRKTIPIALHRFIQSTHTYTIQDREIGIEHNFMTANQKNRSFNILGWQYDHHSLPLVTLEL
jgi:hypothetical protein